MKIFKNNILSIPHYATILFVALVAASCSNENESAPKSGDDDAVVSLSLKAASTSINEDQIFWEDRVDELRMIVFNSSNGETVINQKMAFPNGFANRSKGVRMDVGTYDFYFIANESVYTGDFITALDAISNKSQFTTDTRFTSLQYNPDFIPDGTTGQGRFIMSAIYNNISVASGGTEDNPAPLIIPTGKVELIRALAKIEVIFRKRTAGTTIPSNLITSVQIMNSASDLSVPPYDNYYSGQKESSNQASLAGLDFSRDSIGAVTFYVPEFLAPQGSTDVTELHINNEAFPIKTDGNRTGIALQRRTVPAISDSSVVRNYHYIVNAYIHGGGGGGGIVQLEAYILPWNKDEYKYVFQGDQQIVIPPVIPTDSGVIIIPVLCDGVSKIEILSTEEVLPNGLQGAYGDVVNYWDPEVQGPVIYKGEPPYYCEKKYGPGWRLINSCELMSFLALFDQAYRIWQSNTWEGVNNNLPFYPLPFRQQAQNLLQNLTGVDLSGIVLTDEGKDTLGDVKLGVIDRYFTPGDIMLREMDFPDGWPYTAPPMNSGQKWYPSEVVVQVKAYWYPGYLDLSTYENRQKVLYEEFQRYDYSSTISRCVRSIE